MISFSPGRMWISRRPRARPGTSAVDPADDRRLVVGVEHVDELSDWNSVGFGSCFFTFFELGAAAQARVGLVDVVVIFCVDATTDRPFASSTPTASITSTAVGSATAIDRR